jgi:hypothetical protein
MKTETVETKSIVKLDPKLYGLTETKAKEIEAMFAPMLAKMVELETEFNEVSGLEVNKETCLKARMLRLKYVKVRTGTAEIHRELKAFYLNGGRFVDGWKNAQLFASQGIEDKLTAIENHFENLERERIARLQEQRAAEMAKYEVDYIPENLGEMPDNVWQNFILGTKTNYEARKAAELKAEQDRIAKEKAEAEERERIRKDNERLMAEAEAKEKQAKIEAEQREKAESERLKKETAERKTREEKERKEREAYEAQLRKEREEKAKVEAELRAKKQAEEKARLEAEAKLRAEEAAKRKAERVARLAPDKVKLEKLASDLAGILYPDLKSQEAKEVLQKVMENQDKVIQFIITQTKTI